MLALDFWFCFIHQFVRSVNRWPLFILCVLVFVFRDEYTYMQFSEWCFFSALNCFANSSSRPSIKLVESMVLRSFFPHSDFWHLIFRHHEEVSCLLQNFSIASCDIKHTHTHVMHIVIMLFIHEFFVVFVQRPHTVEKLSMNPIRIFNVDHITISASTTYSPHHKHQNNHFWRAYTAYVATNPYLFSGQNVLDGLSTHVCLMFHVYVIGYCRWFNNICMSQLTNDGCQSNGPK